MVQETNTKMPNPFTAGFPIQMRLKKLTLRTSIAAATLLLAACAGTGLSGKTPEQIVEQRAQQRLDALMAHDVDTALAFTTPSYRARTHRARYAAQYAGVVSWTAARVEEVECEEDRCNVRIMVSYELPRPRMSNTRPLDETWIKVDGKWYIYHQ